MIRTTITYRINTTVVGWVFKTEEKTTYFLGFKVSYKETTLF